MPSPLPRQVRWSLFARLSPSTAAFPVKKPGRLLQLFFRGLLSIYSRYGLHARRVSQATLYTESSDSFVASAGRFDCYRVERTSSRAGVAPTEVQRLSRRTVTSTIANLRPYFRYPRTIAGLKNVVRRNWLQRIHKYPDDGQDSCAMRQPTPEPSTLRITKANYGARSTNRWLGQAIVSMPGRIR